MPPKSSKAVAAHDDHPKPDSSHKEKGGHGSSAHHHHHHTNGKMKRVISAAGSNLREVTNASSSALGSNQNAAQDHPLPGVGCISHDFLYSTHMLLANLVTMHHLPSNQVSWPSFERTTLHTYRREYRLQTPSSFADPYHQLVLGQRGSMGLHSPSMARKNGARRQSKDDLATSSRKHFNSLGIQETDIIAAVLHKVKNDGITKKRRRSEQMPLLDPDPPYPK